MLNQIRIHHDELFRSGTKIVLGGVFLVLAFSHGAAAATTTSAATVEIEPPFEIDSETARLKVDRVDFEFKGAPVITRDFRRLQKERGTFGPLWCSNLDLKLTDVEVSQPPMITLHDCKELGKGPNATRRFRKVLEAWVEQNSSSRILKKSDGRWEQTEFPHAIFRSDGVLESFVTSSRMRWTLRRDSHSVLLSLDNLKGDSVKFRRNLAGDLESLVLARGNKTLVQYRLSTLLESVQSGGRKETYEYDTEDNIIKILVSESGRAPRLWRFGYNTPEWVSTVLHPDGCTSKWTSARVAENSAVLKASETRSCPRKTSFAPAKAAASKPVSADAAKPSFGLSSTPAKQVMIKRSGPLGMGEEKAQVTLNREGLPILFEIVGADQNVRRLEIEREEISGSTLKIRSKDAEVNFKKRPRDYDSKQLDLLDEYEAWMATWGDR